ncbi:VanZ family protein [Fredinandcohnia humi]
MEKMLDSIQLESGYNMQAILLRFIIRFLPIIYMLWVWLQSSNFNPSKVEGMHTEIGIPIFLMLGIVLEIGHLFEFALLYFLLILAFLTFGKLNVTKELFSFTIAFLYGVLDEVHQYFVPFDLLLSLI